MTVASEVQQPGWAYLAPQAAGGAWYPNQTFFHSGGTAALATDAGARATFAFSGNGVRWIGYRDQWSGIARVSSTQSLLTIR